MYRISILPSLTKALSVTPVKCSTKNTNSADNAKCRHSDECKDMYIKIKKDDQNEWARSNSLNYLKNGFAIIHNTTSSKVTDDIVNDVLKKGMVCEDTIKEICYRMCQLIYTIEINESDFDISKFNESDFGFVIDSLNQLGKKELEKSLKIILDRHNKHYHYIQKLFCFLKNEFQNHPAFQDSKINNDVIPATSFKILHPPLNHWDF